MKPQVRFLARPRAIAAAFGTLFGCAAGHSLLTACTIGELSSGEDVEGLPATDASLLPDTNAKDDGATMTPDSSASDVVVDAVPPNFCAAFPAATLCEDFENGNTLKFPGLEVAPLTNTATVVAGAKSKFVLRAVSDTSTEGAYTRITRTVADATSKFRYACDVNFVQVEDATLNEVCSAWVTIPGKGQHVITAGRDTGGELLIRDGYFPDGAAFVAINQGSGVTVQNNTWTRIEVTVDFAAAAPTIQMKLNGGAATTIDVPVDNAGEGQLILKPTLNWVSNPSVPVEVLFDNIVVDLL